MTSPFILIKIKAAQRLLVPHLNLLRGSPPANLQAVVYSLTEDSARTLTGSCFQIEDYLHDRVQVFDEEFLYETR